MKVAGWASSKNCGSNCFFLVHTLTRAAAAAVVWRARTHNNFHFLLPFNLSLLHTGQSRHGFSRGECSLTANSLLGHQSFCQSNQTLNSLFSICGACCKKSKVVSRPAHLHNLGLTLYLYLRYLSIWFCFSLCIFVFWVYFHLCFLFLEQVRRAK